MWKNIGAGFAGIIVAGLLVWFVEMLGHTVYPPSTDMNFADADADAIRAYIGTLPIGALLFVAAAWFVGTLGGTVAACKIGDARPMIYGIVVGGFMLIATLANLIMIPHPLWFSVLGVLGIVAAAWLGINISGEAATDTE